LSDELRERFLVGALRAKLALNGAEEPVRTLQVALPDQAGTMTMDAAHGSVIGEYEDRSTDLLARRLA
jgi:hypothetical protein